jgi:phenylacetate-CoA ligase
MAEEYEVLRQRHIEYMMGRLPEHLQRLTWPADRLRAERTVLLRHLLRIARTYSPWHRDRLSTVDVAMIDEDRLCELPAMTKSDLMTHFDEIVTDRRITLDLVNTHLAGLTASDAYLLNEFHALASGGSSGVRGAFVWGWDAWATGWLVNMRHQVSDALSDPHPGPEPQGQTFASPAIKVHRYPVTLPLSAIVQGLNRINGRTLMTYASMLATLAAEARAGRLIISPRRVIAVAAPASGDPRRRNGRVGRTDRQ